jgi:hypothetical protein
MFSGLPHQSGVLRPSAYLPRVDCPSPSMLRLAERILRPAKLKVNNQGCMYPQKSSQRRRLAVSQSRLRQIAGQNSVNADFKTRKVGSPIPALLTTPPRAVKKSILSLLFNLMSAFRTAPYLREPLALLGRICIGNFIAFAMNSCPRNISNGLWMDSEPCLQLKSSDGSSSVLGVSLDSRGFGQAEERCDC